MNQVYQAVQTLRDGGVVVYPTDTAYGFAVDATNAKAVEKLYKLKGRDFNKPIHVIFPDSDWLNKMVKLNRPALKLMNKFLPGPLTLILPMKITGPSWRKLSANTKTLGVRLPNNAQSLDLVKKFGKPITTTSANISGMPNCYSVQEVQKQYANSEIVPDLYINGGKLQITAPSTVVSLVDELKILRVGPIKEATLKRALKK